MLQGRQQSIQCLEVRTFVTTSCIQQVYCLWSQILLPHIDTCIRFFLYLYMHASVHSFARSFFCALLFFLPSFKREFVSFHPLFCPSAKPAQLMHRGSPAVEAHFACYRQHGGHHEVETAGSAQSSSNFIGMRSDGVKPKAKVGSNIAANRKGDGKVLIVARPVQH